ncbi:hypothetical protein ACFX11_040841 [Malus domestica]
MKVITTNTCILCDGGLKIVEHALLECPRSVYIWFFSPLCLRKGRHIHGGFCAWLAEVAGGYQLQLKHGYRNIANGMVPKNADEVGELRGIGVVIRNEKGDFVATTTMKTRGVCSALLAQTMVARVAVVFAYNLVATHLEMQEGCNGGYEFPFKGIWQLHVMVPLGTF